MGIEPTTSSLGSLHSTGELRPLITYLKLKTIKSTVNGQNMVKLTDISI